MTIDAKLLRDARLVIWWEDPATFSDGYIIRRLMNFGPLAVWQDLRRCLSNEEMVTYLREAEPGEFSPQSWSYWHCVLGLSEGKMPERNTGDHAFAS